MICVAISDKHTQKCLDILDNVEMAEIRLDLTETALSDFQKIFSHSTKKIATCRFDTTGLQVQREKLKKAVDCGAEYIDIEIETPEVQRTELVNYARERNCRVIISYHNFKETPGLRELYALVDKCFEFGADVAKLATMVKSKEDNARLMALYSTGKAVVSLGMGEIGKVTRLTSLMLGAEFSFAAQDDGRITAPGQITYSAMKKLIEQIKQTLS
ncbi:MAG: type I 3-dehydroquinate dehydratase [Bacteroidales bacterium]|nr:type I 3-dehydroquinate dehydratase [Bacteroidales bacterium]MBN2818255.1 type I 3-dehydroquinate dehydratase [Bacteroidales bacterium]